mgnify:CR=1 FL=1|jgi:hypothetical protein
MEFSFNPSKLLQCNQDGFAIIDASNPTQYRKTGAGFNAHRSSSFFNQNQANSTPEEQIDTIIDSLGSASAKAQKLPSIITTSSKLFTSDNRLYVRANGK